MKPKQVAKLPNKVPENEWILTANGFWVCLHQNLPIPIPSGLDIGDGSISHHEWFDHNKPWGITSTEGYPYAVNVMPWKTIGELTPEDIYVYGITEEELKGHSPNETIWVTTDKEGNSNLPIMDKNYNRDEARERFNTMSEEELKAHDQRAFERWLGGIIWMNDAIASGKVTSQAVIGAMQ